MSYTDPCRGDCGANHWPDCEPSCSSRQPGIYSKEHIDRWELEEIQKQEGNIPAPVEQPAEINHRDYQDIKMALTLMVRSFEKAEKTKSQQKLFDGAKDLLKKHFRITDILRSTPEQPAEKGERMYTLDEIKKAHWHGWFCRERYIGHRHIYTLPEQWMDMDYEEHQEWFANVFISKLPASFQPPAKGVEEIRIESSQPAKEVEGTTEGITDVMQWVIDNRYPKSENDKMSDHELYHTLSKKVEALLKENESVSGIDKLLQSFKSELSKQTMIRDHARTEQDHGQACKVIDYLTYVISYIETN